MLHKDYILNSNIFKENLAAAKANPGKRTGHQCYEDALHGSAGEIGAFVSLRDVTIGLKKNHHTDHRMVVGFDLCDSLYRYEVKCHAAGAFATFHSKEGLYSDNGLYGFDLTSVRKHGRADWLLIMKWSREPQGFIVQPAMMVWLPTMDKYAIKGRTGYYFDHRLASVEDEFLVGDDVKKYLKKMCTFPNSVI